MSNEIVDDDLFEEEVQQEKRGGDLPLIGEPEWSDYVLGLLTEDELFEGNPKVSGLRRVAVMLLGDISSETRVIAASPQYAACTVSIRTDMNRTYEGAGECNAELMDAPYNMYPLAISETRAEARALRKLLCLGNIVTADEINNSVGTMFAPPDEKRTAGKITDTQIKFIDRMCKSIGVDVFSVMKWALEDSGLAPPANKLGEISHSEALVVHELLDKLSREESVDEKYGKYNPEWKVNQL